MSHLLLSFSSGIVRPMLATRVRPDVFGKFPAEAEHRCATMKDTARVIEKETYTVIGEVRHQADGYHYYPNPKATP